MVRPGIEVEHFDLVNAFSQSSGQPAILTDDAGWLVDAISDRRSGLGHDFENFGQSVSFGKMDADHEAAGKFQPWNNSKAVAPGFIGRQWADFKRDQRAGRDPSYWNALPVALLDDRAKRRQHKQPMIGWGVSAADKNTGSLLQDARGIFDIQVTIVFRRDRHNAAHSALLPGLGDLDTMFLPASVGLYQRGDRDLLTGSSHKIAGGDIIGRAAAKQEELSKHCYFTSTTWPAVMVSNVLGDKQKTAWGVPAAAQISA
jgi:hypothetical protein